MRIPKVFHWIWFGDAPLPDEHRRWIDGWLVLHPDWSHVQWTDANRPTLVNEEQFLQSASPAQRSDIARYEIVRTHGGVYLDTDFECLRNLEPLLAGADAFVVKEDARQLSNGIFGSTAGHPWLDDVVARLPSSLSTAETIPEQSGPRFLTAVTRGRPDVAVFEPDLFYPYPWEEPWRRAERFSGAYAVHHWASSWMESDVARLQKATTEIEALLPSDARFALLDERLGLRSKAASERAIPFPPWDSGRPSDDAEAIELLERVRREGADFLVVLWEAFWWLDHYRGFASAFERVAETDTLIVFDLARTG